MRVVYASVLAALIAGGLSAAVDPTVETEFGTVAFSVRELVCKPIEPRELARVSGAKDGADFTRLGGPKKYGQRYGLATPAPIKLDAGNVLQIEFEGRAAAYDDTFIVYCTPFDKDGKNICDSTSSPSGWFASPHSHTYNRYLIAVKKTNEWETISLELAVPFGVDSVTVCVAPWRGNGVDCRGFSVKSKGTHTYRPIVFETREPQSDGTLYTDPANAISLKLKTAKDAAGFTTFAATVTDIAQPSRPRALDVDAHLKCDLKDWTYHKDWRETQPIVSKTGYGNVKQVNNHKLSTYPFIAVTHGKRGIALGTRFDDATFEAHYAAIDGLRTHRPLGLLERGPDRQGCTATFDWILYGFDGTWGFRAAAEVFYAHEGHKFPKFEKPIKEGCWLWPVAPHKLPPKAEELGLAIWEVPGGSATAKDVEAAHQLGITAYPYTEAWGMRQRTTITDRSLLPPLAERIDELKAWASPTNTTKERWFAMPRAMAAEVLLNTVPIQPDGSYAYVEDRWDTWTTWWRTNPDPRLPEPNRGLNCWKYEIEPVLSFSDGIYLDSVSFGFSVNYLNCRPEHLVAYKEPLIYEDTHGRPCTSGIQHMTTFIEWIGKRIHAMGKRVFGNGHGIAVRMNALNMDFFGHEVDAYWAKNDAEREQSMSRIISDTEAGELRFYAYHRQISNLLQEGSYEKIKTALTPKGVANYIEHQLFYGMYPGICTIGGEDRVGYKGWRRYYDHARQCERDREQFKVAVPMIRRLNKAGWEPVTHLRTSDTHVLVERYGAMNREGECFFTLRNASDKPAKVTLTPDDDPISRFAKLTNVWHEEVQPIRVGERWTVEIAPWQTLVLKAIAADVVFTTEDGKPSQLAHRMEYMGLTTMSVKPASLDDAALASAGMFVAMHGDAALSTNAQAAVSRFKARGGFESHQWPNWKRLPNDTWRRMTDVEFCDWLANKVPAFKPTLDRKRPEFEARVAKNREDAKRFVEVMKAGGDDEIRSTSVHNAYGPGGYDHDPARGDWMKHCANMKNLGINMLSMNCCNASWAYYRSKVLPVSPLVDLKGDAFEQCKAACERYGLKFVAWRVCFKGFGKEPSPQFQQWLKEGRGAVGVDGKIANFLCPSHPLNRKLEVDAFVEMAQKRPYAINLDYIRNDSGNYCFCDHCRDEFARFLGVAKIEDWPKSARMGGKLYDRWCDYRAETITSLVRDISKAVRAAAPGVVISASVLALSVRCHLGRTTLVGLGEGGFGGYLFGHESLYAKSAARRGRSSVG